MSFTETLNERSKSQHYFTHIESATHGAGLGQAGVAARTHGTERCWLGFTPQAGCAQMRLPSLVYALQIS